MQLTRPLKRDWTAALLVMAATSACVILPFLYYGIPSGHDFEFHMNSWIEVVDHWKQGVVYPHWAALAHYGYGEVRFIFYPPLSWTLGGLLGLVLPWKLVPAAYIWIVLTLCGCSMFVLASRWLSGRDALWAAAIYAANPYHLVIVYWRSAFAELLASACLPLLLLLILKLDEEGPRVVAPLSLLLAAGWLTNLPSAVMMNYSLAVLLACAAISRRSLALLPYGAAAAVLGATLAGFYLLPAFHEQSWVNISQVLAPGVRPQDNFLFSSTTDPDHNRFNLLASIVALSEIVLLAVLLFLSRRVRAKRLWWLMTVWGVLSTVLMLKPTFLLWMHLPELRFVQLPWRWLLCLNVPFALAVPLAMRRWWLRALICGAALASVLLTWHHVLVPWWDKAADVQEMVDNENDGIGNEGTDEYVPAGIDPYDADQHSALVRFDGQGKAQIRIDEWHAEERSIAINANAAGRLVLRLFNYRSWRVIVDRRTVQSASTKETGQMTIPVGAGEHHLQIKFVPGRDRWLGSIISVIALLVIVLSYVGPRLAARVKTNPTASA